MPLSRPVSNQQIALFLALERAGIALSVDEFDQRLVLQKAVCLLQSAKVHLGYTYRWYLRGPYCPALTEDVFYLVGLPQEDRSELRTWVLDPGSVSNIDGIRGLLAAETTKERADKLELLGSIAFLADTRQINSNDVESTTKVLKNAGKPYSAQQVGDAIQKLKSHGLIA